MPLRLVDLIDMSATDPSDPKLRRTVLKAIMQCDDERIAASLNERSTKTGCTLLQAAFFALIQAERPNGVSDAREKFIKVLNDHMDDLDIDAVNNAGQALVHIACSPTTYSRKRSDAASYYWQRQPLPNLLNPQEWESFPVPAGFAIKVLHLLVRAGVDFNMPDENGFIPVLGLARLAPECPALISFLTQMALTRRRAQIPFSLNYVEKETGDSVLHLMWAGSRSLAGMREDLATLRDAQRLAGETRLLERLDLLAVNLKQETPLMRLAALASTQLPRPGWNLWAPVVPVRDWVIALPTNMLQAWQEARAPRYKVELEEFLIPDLSDICCELCWILLPHCAAQFVLGRKVRAGRPLSAEERHFLFAVSAQSFRVSAEWRLMERKANAAATSIAHAHGGADADGNADGGGMQVEGDGDGDGPGQQQILAEGNAGAEAALAVGLLLPPHVYAAMQMAIGAQQNDAAGGDGPAPMEF